MPDNHVDLPLSAADEAPVLAAPEAAYIRNPIADRTTLTPLEALEAIAKLSMMLKIDEVYRAHLAARTVPDEG